MPSSLDVSTYHNLLRSYLAEDVGAGDITTESTVSSTQRACGELIAKAPLVLAGIELFGEVFCLLDSATEVEICSRDGEELKPGKIPAPVTAPARPSLPAQPVPLNPLHPLPAAPTPTPH